MILSARYVHSPRYARICDECGKRIGPHVYLYGNAHDVDPPSALRLCLRCVRPESAAREPKIAAVLAEAERRAGDVAAEQLALEQWNADQPKRGMKNEESRE